MPSARPLRWSGSCARSCRAAISGSGWAKSYQSEDGAQRLAADAVRVLGDFGLARRIGDRTVPRPAEFRYRTTVTDGPAI
ncbi:DUF2398 family protein [Kitasatospora sp. NPDC048296]|uniref:DUF2398 family protein n=1 Tax=Kitasatospora sp. NPDC048296 TaxID=3364048 RepID=UPI00371099EB